MDYTNREVVRRLKQYDMFLSSLNVVNDETKKERICDQLDKIEKQILLETNNVYEEEYRRVLAVEADSFEEEKDRLRNLIITIEERRKYLNDRKRTHKEHTGSIVELTTFLGEDKLGTYKRNLEIIETYEKNKEEEELIKSELKTLDIKISEASRNVKANARLADILENKMEELVGKALEEAGVFDYAHERDDIKEKHSTLEYALDMAKENLKGAKELNNTYMILECDNILSEVTLEYNAFHEKLCSLELMDIYDEKTSDHDALITKRERIEGILKQIPESKLYNELYDELNKELATIRLQKQDIDTYESLKNERQSKVDRLNKLEDEDNSPEFKNVLDELIENENRLKEERIKLAKKKAQEERQAKLLEEQKLEASRRRRQKLIEDARMKEQQERLNKVKELQDNTIIGTKKEEKFDNPFMNLTIDDIFKENKESEEPKEKSILEEVMDEVKEEPKEEQEEKKEDLFKEIDSPSKLEITSEEKEDKKEDKPFDFSEFDDIPIIENNNLKPELVEEIDNDNDSGEDSFPKLNDEEGEILWKETL